MEARVQRLNDSGRLDELRPTALLEELGVTKGMVCIDLGSGTGVFALPMADLVGTEGLVYAVDSSADMIDYLRTRAPRSNLRLVLADAGCTGLDSEMADFCLLAFVLHEVKDPEAVLTEVNRILKRGGTAAVPEWRLDAHRGPPPDLRISCEKAAQLLEHAGFAVTTQHDWSPNHYVIAGQKRAVSPVSAKPAHE